MPDIPAWHLAPVETGPSSMSLLVPADLAAICGSFSLMGGKAQIFDCTNVGVFISPVSYLLKPVIHFCDSVL